MDKLYKVLDKDGKGPYSEVAWSLPHDGQPGEWMPPVEGELVLCKNGYHLCTHDHLVRRLNARIFEVEYRGERLDAGNEVIVREARLLRELATWNERTQRLFACDCAEHMLHIFERKYPGIKEPRKCIEMARRHADGNATKEELTTTWAIWPDKSTWDNWAIYLAGAARATTRVVAHDAAWAAPWIAALATVEDTRCSDWGPDWDARRHWQTEKLFEYLEGERE